ncbi:hypothetical protein Pgin02_01856 [Porphyromonas gingivalis]
MLFALSPFIRKPYAWLFLLQTGAPDLVQSGIEETFDAAFGCLLELFVMADKGRYFLVCTHLPVQFGSAPSDISPCLIRRDPFMLYRLSVRHD